MKKIFATYSDWSQWRGQAGGCGYYRILQPLRYLHDDFKLKVMGCDVDTNEELSVREDNLKDVDMYFGEHTDNPVVLNEILEFKKKYGFKYVIEIDDDYFNIDPLNPILSLDPLIREKQKWCAVGINNADALVVTSESLKNLYEPLNKNIYVCPNQIDPDEWRDLPTAKRKDKNIRIGWTGGTSHERDLELLVEPLTEILKKNQSVTLVLCGYFPICFDSLPKDRIEFHNGTEGYFQYPTYLNKLNIDIGLAPLIESQFNRCKSNIKWMEYAMTKTPCVVSPVAPYLCVENGVDGLVANSSKEWVEQIEKLIHSEKLRKQLWMNAKNKILKEYNIKKNWILWKNAIDDILAK